MYIVYGLNVGHAAEWYVSSQMLLFKKKIQVESIWKKKDKKKSNKVEWIRS